MATKKKAAAKAPAKKAPAPAKAAAAPKPQPVKAQKLERAPNEVKVAKSGQKYVTGTLYKGPIVASKKNAPKK